MKKGISPLIATVLIVGFTVVLAVIVMTWGQTWFGGLTTSTDTAAQEQLACINEGKIRVSACDAGTDTRVTVTNTGATTITTAVVSVCDSAGCEEESFSSLSTGASGTSTTTGGIDPATSVTSTYTFTSSVGVVTCQGASISEVTAC